MTERPPNTPESFPFEKGALVRLKRNLDDSLYESLGSQIERKGVYRVYHIERHTDKGGEAIWIGPHDAPLRDVEEFKPEKTVEGEEERYKNVFAVSSAHLERVVPD